MTSTLQRTAVRAAVRALATTVILASLAASAGAATKYTVSSGAWEATGAWSTGGPPGTSDDVIVLSGHVVTR